jgi:thiamine pyrophosphate-dependent acetolactate synthase large subunit-like protein
MKVFEAVAEQLTAAGVSHVFGIMGDANMQLIADLDGRDVTYVAATHEANAVLMAEAFSKARATLGVLTVTHGPAITNTLTPLVEAVRNRSPLLLITGTTPQRIRHVQELDVAAAFQFTGARVIRVRSAQSAAADTVAAMRTALIERVPTVLDIPFDMVGLEVDPADDAVVAQRVGGLLSLWLTERPAMPIGRSGTPNREDLEAAVAALAGARRVVVLAGAGAATPEARAALVELADKVGGCLATSLKGRSAFAGHPYNLGVMGTVATSVASETIASADCIVAFGASLNPFTTYGATLLEGKRVIQCDSDTQALGRNLAVDVALLGDSAETARALADMFGELVDSAPAGMRTDELRKRLADYRPSEEFTPYESSDSIDPRLAFIRVNEVVPPTRTVVTDAGWTSVTSWPFWDVPDPRYFQPATTWGCIGLGLGTAIGAAIAVPENTTVLVVGDGAWAMSFGELNTAVRLGLRLLVLVCRDGGYGAEYVKLVNYGLDPALAQIAWSDPVEVARAMGAEAHAIHSLEDLAEVEPALKDLEGPMVLSLTVAPDYLVNLGMN